VIIFSLVLPGNGGAARTLCQPAFTAEDRPLDLTDVWIEPPFLLSAEFDEKHTFLGWIASTACSISSMFMNDCF